MSRCCRFFVSRRREEDAYRQWSVTDEQRRRNGKMAQPGGRERLGPSSGVARSSQVGANMFVARALPSRPRHSRATCLSVPQQAPNAMGSGWRIVRASRAQTAPTGEGAWRYGGRWNSPGARVVYIARYQSTAAFEVFVNRIPFTVEEHYPKHFTLSGRTVSQNASDTKNCRRTGGSILLQSKRGKSATAGSKSGALRFLRCQAPLALPTQIFCSTPCIQISSASE